MYRKRNEVPCDEASPKGTQEAPGMGSSHGCLPDFGNDGFKSTMLERAKDQMWQSPWKEEQTSLGDLAFPLNSGPQGQTNTAGSWQTSTQGDVFLKPQPGVTYTFQSSQLPLGTVTSPSVRIVGRVEELVLQLDHLPWLATLLATVFAIFGYTRKEAQQPLLIWHRK